MSKLHVSQLNAGMDLGPAHRDIALSHLTMRGTGLHACEEVDYPEDPGDDLGPDPKAPGGPEWEPEPETEPSTMSRPEHEELLHRLVLVQGSLWNVHTLLETHGHLRETSEVASINEAIARLYERLVHLRPTTVSCVAATLIP